ncbi:MAG: hypothetical protein IKW59_09185 [Clostridia bacterium]|nr:hypothetical protein [Clostridia bacterium]
MSIINGIREFIAGCPLICEGKINVDFLGAEPVEYSVERISTDEVIKRYSDGGMLKKFVFAITSREYVGMSVDKHLKAAEFHEKFSEWIAAKNDMGELPDIGKDKVTQSIRVSSSGVLKDMADDCAKYSIECTVVYFEGGI